MEPLAWLTCPDPKLSDALAYLAHNPGKQLRSRRNTFAALAEDETEDSDEKLRPAKGFNWRGEIF